MSAHVPGRPHWTCRACAAEWPCAPAWNVLARMTRTTRCVHLAGYLLDALHDLPQVAPGVLFRRFLAPARRAVTCLPPR